MATKTYKYFEVVFENFKGLLEKLKIERTKPDEEKDANLISALESSANVVSIEMSEATKARGAGVSDQSILRFAAAIESTKEAPAKPVKTAPKTPKKKAKK
jgi:hypothetical protein